jgi:tetratricopeptide (TPR) repeat protein
MALSLFSDKDVASVYLKKASDLIKKKEYKEALTNFKKAINEEPEMAETYMALGEMYRDLGESKEAKLNFDKSLTFINDQGQTDKLKALANKINSYLTEYGKNRQELDRINEQFLTALLPLLDKYENEDPELALSTVEKALKIRPNDQMLLDKKKDLAQKSSDARRDQMTALYNGGDFNDWDITPEYWTIENNLIKFDCDKGSTISAITHKTKIVGDYNLVAKVRFDNSYSSQSILALSFGFQSIASCYAFGFFDQKLVLAKHTRDAEGFARLMEKDISAINISDWNELEVEIYGSNIRCYLNGELYFELDEFSKGATRGCPALIGNNCSGYLKDVMYSSDE